MEESKGECFRLNRPQAILQGGGFLARMDCFIELHAVGRGLHTKLDEISREELSVKGRGIFHGG